MGKIMIGIDVAKEWVDIAIAGESRVRRIENTEQAVDAWLAEIDPGSMGLVAFEPTGGYERVVRRCLHRVKVAFAQVHPSEVIAFRRRRGMREDNHIFPKNGRDIFFAGGLDTSSDKSK